MWLLKIYSEHKKLIRTVFFLIGLFFVLALVKESWTEISVFLGQIKPVKFIFSVIVAVTSNVVIALLFNCLLGKHGVSISNALALKMHLVGQIAKYIPGKIWSVAYQITHVTGKSGAAGVMLANVELMFSVMFIISIVAMALVSFLSSKILALLITLFGMGGFVFLYKTNVINKIIIYLSGKIKSIGFLSEIECKKTSYVTGILFFFSFSLLYVISNVLLLDAVFGFSFRESIIYIALLSLAWLGGVFVFIMPLGLGVREFLFVYTSSYVIPDNSIETLLAIAVITRFAQIIQEITGVCLLLFVRR